MSRRPSREETRAASLAAALTRDAATKNSDSPDIAPDAYARFLAVAGAYVVIALDEREAYVVTCESCGQLPDIGSYNPATLAQAAQNHAETCRRIPKRLWPDGGAK